MQIDNTRIPQQDRSREKKQRLLFAAEELFTEKGYERTNSKEIAKRANVAIGSFYSYYKDKSVLFIDIVESYYNVIFSRIHDTLNQLIKSSTSIKDIVEGGVKTIYKAHQIKPELHREISIILLKGANYRDRDNPNSEFYRTINSKVEVLDKEVQNWLYSILQSWIPNRCEKELLVISNLIFRVSEETIHRIIQFPESMENPQKIIEELSIMITSYISSMTENTH